MPAQLVELPRGKSCCATLLPPHIVKMPRLKKCSRPWRDRARIPLPGGDKPPRQNYLPTITEIRGRLWGPGNCALSGPVGTFPVKDLI